MKLETVEVSVVGSIGKMMYGIRISNVPLEILYEMNKHAKSIGGVIVNGVNTVWFENESDRTLFLLRWQ